MDDLEVILDRDYPRMKFEDFLKIVPEQHRKNPQVKILYEVLINEEDDKKKKILQLFEKEIGKTNEREKITMEEVLVHLKEFDENLQKTLNTLREIKEKRVNSVKLDCDKVIALLTEMPEAMIMKCTPVDAEMP